MSDTMIQGKMAGKVFYWETYAPESTEFDAACR